MAAGNGIEIIGPPGDRFGEILTPGALNLVALLQRDFGARRAELLAARAARQQELLAGGTLDFPPATRHIREDPLWRGAPPPPVAAGTPGGITRATQRTRS